MTTIENRQYVEEMQGRIIYINKILFRMLGHHGTMKKSTRNKSKELLLSENVK